ncbi:pilus assembly protein [Xanthomonas translucens pv. translucens]|uniref:TadE family protein n=1 Tax=Xanthomonas campestris pv. translucens TaxID=343 RepID=UPI0021B7D950|nr:TadE family protein [Xanthomonas translucens]MCT8285260.1 pilus assembly protein [Xanthomonas translucens pv. translucens]MCT8302918.1 pilus assembly protein [Xanthomonas translucens pv. translucens]
MKTTFFSPARRMRGQGMVELAVCAALLVPLFLLIPVVAKLGHSKQMAMQAARNAAWEASVANNYQPPGRALLQQRALDRSFADADTPITSRVSSSSGAFADQMLNTFSNRKLLEKSDLSITRTSNGGSPGYVDNAAALVPQNFADNAFPPNRNGYVTAEVALNYRDLKTTDGRPARFLEPLDNLNLVDKRHQTLLTDAWNASGPRSGPRSVVSAVRPLAPVSYFSGLDRIFDMVKPLKPILPMVGSLGDLELGTIEPDIVPSDKLANSPIKPVKP